MKTHNKLSLTLACGILAGSLALSTGCRNTEGTTGAAIGSDTEAAAKVFVAPGKHDEYYSFLSGGFNGQVDVYGLPSGRLLKVIPVFSQNPENGYGYNEES